MMIGNFANVPVLQALRSGGKLMPLDGLPDETGEQARLRACKSKQERNGGVHGHYISEIAMSCNFRPVLNSKNVILLQSRSLRKLRQYCRN